jgi:hypothetical protein
MEDWKMDLVAIWQHLSRENRGSKPESLKLFLIIIEAIYRN